MPKLTFSRASSPSSRKLLRSRMQAVEALEQRIAMSADFGGAVGQLPGSNLLTVFVDTDRDPSDEIRFDYGLPGDVAVAGDWNRDGFDNVGMVRAHPDGFAQWLLDTNRDPHAEHIFRFGLNGDHMLVADFNGDSIDDIAAVRAAPVVDPVVGLPRLTWYISYGPFDDLPHDSFASVSNVMEYGFQGDKPVAGDWDGDGAANPGIVSQVPVFYGGTAINRWYLQGSTHVDFGFPTDIPIVGDWNGNGADNVGAIREQPGAPSFWFGDTNGDPTDEVRFQFGLQGYQYIAGSWQPDDIAPTASLSAPDPSQGSSRTNIVVHYNDNNYIDSPQFGHGDLRVTGPGYTQAARLESVSGNGRSYTVTYSISAPGGQWDAADNGTYTIEVLPNRVCDLSDNCVQPGPLAEFTVNFAGSGTQIVDEDFEDGRWDDSFDVCYCVMSEVTDTMSHGQGTHSFLTRMVGPEPEGTLDLINLQFESIYVSFYQKMPDGLPFAGDADLKLSRLPHDVGGVDLSLTVTYDPEESTPYYIAKIKNSEREEVAYWPHGPDHVRDWFRVAYYMRYNDVGQHNGVLKVWLDDLLLIDETNVDFRARGAATADIMWIGGNLSRHVPSPSDPLERFIDDIVVLVDGDAPDSDPFLASAAGVCCHPTAGTGDRARQQDLHSAFTENAAMAENGYSLSTVPVSPFKRMHGDRSVGESGDPFMTDSVFASSPDDNRVEQAAEIPGLDHLLHDLI